MSIEPGLDRHEWESRMEALNEDLRDDPASGLPELADLVEEMLIETGYDVDDPTVREGDEREIVAEYLAARETSDRVERDEDFDPGDVGAAVNGLRAIFGYLVEQRSAR
jgi:hypothetical protein